MSPGATSTLETRNDDPPPDPLEPLELLVEDDDEARKAGRDPNASPYCVATPTVPVATAVLETVPRATAALRYWVVDDPADAPPRTA
jgi:hypothetical protein